MAAVGILAGNSKLPVLSNAKKLPASAAAVTTTAKKVTSATDQAAIRRSGLGQLPLSFEPNVGQTDEDARFVSRGPGYTLYLTADEAVMVLRNRPLTNKHEVPREDAEAPGVVRMKVVGADRAAAVRGADKLQSYSNYLYGKDPAKWHTNVPNYGRVEYSSVYPGVDLVYYGNQRQLEYDFVVKPGGDPSRIQLAFDGADKLRTDKGDLVLSVRGREIRQFKPVVYQTIAGKRVPVASGYELIAGSKQVKFSVAKYDRNQPLVIDPTISYASYLGGSGDDNAFGVALDSSGNVYLTGDTTTAAYPHTATIGTTAGGLDAFVTKINPANSGASSLVWSTYFGGSGLDIGNGIRVDGTGEYVVGSTNSTDFPVTASHTPAVPQTTLAGGFDAFIAKLNSTGTAFLYSTYFGGTGTEFDFSLGITSNGDAYVVGQTDSPNLTNSSPAYVQQQLGGGTDAFVTRIKADGSLGYATYLGGSANDHGLGIAVDSTGAAYVVGDTASTNFPVVNAFTSGSSSGAGFKGGVSDGFITKLTQTINQADNTTSGLTIGYSSFLGGSSEDIAYDVALDAGSNAYVTGLTNSTNFPVTNGSTALGGLDAFVTKVSNGGAALTYSTYFGGSADDYGQGVSVDSNGEAYVAGNTASNNLPTGAGTQSASQPSFGGNQDAFVVKFTAAGTGYVYVTYFGGSQTDSASGIVADAAGLNAYVSGGTSGTLPSAINGYQTTYQGGNSDAYVLVLHEAPPATSTMVNPTSLNFTAVQNQGSSPAQTLTLTGSASTIYSVSTSVQGNAANFLIATPQGTISNNTPSIGSNPTISVTINQTVASTLAPGTYAGNVSITTSLNEKINVPVTLVITVNNNSLYTTHPISLYNTSVNYTLNPQTSTNTLQNQSITIALNSQSNTGTPASYTSTVNVVYGAANFVTVSPASGTTSGGTSGNPGNPGTAAVTITSNPFGLTAGTYIDTVTFSASGFAPTTYTVTLTIENPFVSTTGSAQPSKVGVFRPTPGANSGPIFVLDKNGDGTFIGGDKVVYLGQPGDIPITGDWTGDGIKKAGIYRPFGSANGPGIFILDTNNSGAYEAGTDQVLALPASADPTNGSVAAGDVPVVGDWAGTGVDRVGIFRNGTFYLDVKGDGSFTGNGGSGYVGQSGRAFLGQAGDIPIIGNWNGVGKASKVGIFRPSAGFFLVDSNGDGQYTGADQPLFYLGQNGDAPLVGDWNGDGRSKVGVFRPATAANGNTYDLFILDFNGNYAYDGPATDKVLVFAVTTLPAVNDEPVTGNWVPSYLGPASVQGRTRVGIFRPGVGTFYLDVNGDGSFVGRAFLGGATNDLATGVPIVSGQTVVGANQMGNY